MVQRELRPVEFPPGCEASDKGPATEFVYTEKGNPERGLFSNSWCFELRSSARTTSPFLERPRQAARKALTWRRTSFSRGTCERRQRGLKQPVCFSLLLFLSNLFLSLLSRGATTCQCFFSPLTGKCGGLLRGVLLVSPCVIKTAVC